MPTPARPCQGRCGYFVLSGTHCCSACKIKNGRHGPLCKKYIPPEEAFRSLADELPAVPGAGDKTTTDETLSSRPLTPTNASADAPTSRHVTPTKAPADNMAATTTPPASVTPRSSPPPSAEPPRSSWYPGKNLHVAYQRTKEWRAQIREAKQRGAFQPARRPLKNLRNVLRQKRPLRERSGEGIGQLHLTVVGGRFRTKRAYVIAELDGNECRTDVATCDTPSWDASFSFAVHDPSYAGAGLSSPGRPLGSSLPRCWVGSACPPLRALRSDPILSDPIRSDPMPMPPSSRFAQVGPTPVSV